MRFAYLSRLAWLMRACRRPEIGFPVVDADGCVRKGSSLRRRVHGLLRSERARHFLQLSARVGLLVVGFLGVERWVVGVTSLPLEAYEQPLITLQIAESLIAIPRTGPAFAVRALGVLGLLYVLVRHTRDLGASWRGVDEGGVLRWMIAAPLVCLTWAYSTYDANLFFGRSHLVDRWLLVVLCVAALRRPAMVLPFVMLVTGILFQFDHPIGGYSVAEQFLLVRLLLLFTTYFLLRIIGVPLRPSDLVLSGLAALAAHYFVPGLGKLRMGWFSVGAVPLLLPATYLNGWLGFLDPETLGTLTERLLYLDPLLVAGAFLLELCALFALVRRRLLLFYLALWICFHLTVFFFSGIFFWKWIALELTLLLLFLRRGDRPALAVFTPSHAALSVALIGSGALWAGPVNLSWFNSAVSYTYRFEAVTEGGRQVWLGPGFFAPYQYQFTMTGFGYLSPRRQLGVTWGAVSERDIAEATFLTRSPGEIAGLEQARGSVRYDAAKAQALDDFLLQFVKNWNDDRPEQRLWTKISAPPQLWSFAPDGAFAADERISQVVVHQVTSFFDGRRVHEIGPERLRTIDIPRMGR